MNKIEKFLKKLTSKERNKLAKLLSKVINLELDSLDIQKMKKIENHFRIREGKIRIVFRKEQGKGVVVNIDYRGRVYGRL
jgi:mRNA-degrading endonuclease RelE of RelBE toxin-antitoxin system